MGYMKERMLQEDAQGWYFVSGELFVCQSCFDDYGIKSFIVEHAIKNECSYCNQRSTKPIATAMNDVLGHIGESISVEYGDSLEEGVPYDEGEYVFGTPKVISELLDEIGWPTENELVKEEILGAFRDGFYVQRDFFSLPEDKRLAYGWKNFVDVVKHETRYLFTLKVEKASHNNPDYISPGEMLRRVGAIYNDVNLFRKIEKGTRWYRGREHHEYSSKEKYLTAIDLGTVPQDEAIYSNRMSPAGIPMFYGAADKQTALRETMSSKPGPKRITIGTFEAARDFYVLDLTNIPEVPSLFDENGRILRAGIKFLHGFVNDLAKPIQRDGREHIEYVPTQVVTEYVRHCFKASFKRQVRGILYRSSQNAMGICCVFFFLNENCCDAVPGWMNNREKWLGLIRSSSHLTQ